MYLKEHLAQYGLPQALLSALLVTSSLSTAWWALTHDKVFWVVVPHLWNFLSGEVHHVFLAINI